MMMINITDKVFKALAKEQELLFGDMCDLILEGQFKGAVSVYLELKKLDAIEDLMRSTNG